MSVSDRLMSHHAIKCTAIGSNHVASTHHVVHANTAPMMSSVIGQDTGIGALQYLHVPQVLRYDTSGMRSLAARGCLQLIQIDLPSNILRKLSHLSSNTPPNEPIMVPRINQNTMMRIVVIIVLLIE